MIALGAEGQLGIGLEGPIGQANGKVSISLSLSDFEAPGL